MIIGCNDIYLGMWNLPIYVNIWKIIWLEFLPGTQRVGEAALCQASDKPVFQEMVNSMISSPVIPMVWKNLNVVQISRIMLFKMVENQLLHGTIRGSFCVKHNQKVVHGLNSS